MPMKLDVREVTITETDGDDSAVALLYSIDSDSFILKVSDEESSASIVVTAEVALELATFLALYYGEG